jgi:hypothetical protein
MQNTASSSVAHQSTPACAPLAQLDRASDYESEGREFESLRARHTSRYNNQLTAAASRSPTDSRRNDEKQAPA